MLPIAFKILSNAVSEVGCTPTFDPTTCYLVDYNLYYKTTRQITNELALIYAAYFLESTFIHHKYL